jgi:hypothetical protein
MSVVFLTNVWVCSHVISDIYWAPIIARVNCKSGLYYEARAVIENSQMSARFVDYCETNSLLISGILF